MHAIMLFSLAVPRSHHHSTATRVHPVQLEGRLHARRTRIDISLPIISTEESLEELGTDPVVAALAQKMAREAVQHLEGLHVLVADVQGDLLDLLLDRDCVPHHQPRRPMQPATLLDCMGDVDQGIEILELRLQGRLRVDRLHPDAAPLLKAAVLKHIELPSLQAAHGIVVSCLWMNPFWTMEDTYNTWYLNSLSAKSILAGEKLVATYSISS